MDTILSLELYLPLLQIHDIHVVAGKTLFKGSGRGFSKRVKENFD